jgi:hypothetical protein
MGAAHFHSERIHSEPASRPLAKTTKVSPFLAHSGWGYLILLWQKWRVTLQGMKAKEESSNPSYRTPGETGGQIKAD